MRKVLVPVIRRSTRLEAVRKCRPVLVSTKLAPSNRGEGSQVGAGRAAVDESKNFVDFEVQHVARRVEHATSMQAAAELEKDLSNSREQARPLEPQVLAVADPAARMLQHPAQSEPADRVPGERARDTRPCSRAAPGRRKHLPSRVEPRQSDARTRQSLERAAAGPRATRRSRASAR